MQLAEPAAAASGEERCRYYGWLRGGSPVGSPARSPPFALRLSRYHVRLKTPPGSDLYCRQFASADQAANGSQTDSHAGRYVFGGQQVALSATTRLNSVHRYVLQRTQRRY